MNKLPTVCCVIVLDKDNNILLVKRGREPHMNKWSLISGTGYTKKEKTLEEGVVDEVFGDIGVLPLNIKKLFSIRIDSQEVVVFIAYVNRDGVIAIPPYVVDICWCTKEEISSFRDLAFDHEAILEKFTTEPDYFSTLRIDSL